MALHEVGDFQAQAFDQVAGGGLADIAAGIAVAELQGHAAGAAEIGLVMRAAERFFQDAGAVFERFRGFEERADFDPVLDAEAAGEPEGGEQRGAGFRLGDEEADVGGGIDVFDDLRHCHDQLGGRGLLGEQRAEIDGGGLHLVEGGVERGQQGAAMGAVGRRFFQAEHEADGVVHLGGVEAHMGVGERQPVGEQAGAGDGEGEFVVIGSGFDGGGEKRGENDPAEHGFLAAGDQRGGEDFGGFGIGAGGAGFDLFAATVVSACAMRAASAVAVGRLAIWACTRCSCRRFMVRRRRSVSHQPISVRPSVS